MTEDYRRHARGPCSRNPPSADDKNLEGRLSRPSTSPQIRQTPGQEGTGRLYCITGARDCTQSGKLHRHPILKNNSDQPIEHLAGEQIAQLLFIKVATPTLVQVTSLARTERGEYGFGAHTN